jgi:hypothetical protein
LLPVGLVGGGVTGGVAEVGGAGASVVVGVALAVAARRPS